MKIEEFSFFIAETQRNFARQGNGREWGVASRLPGQRDDCRGVTCHARLPKHIRLSVSPLRVCGRSVGDIDSVIRP